jgi:hypothetical protein
LLLCACSLEQGGLRGRGSDAGGRDGGRTRDAGGDAEPGADADPGVDADRAIDAGDGCTPACRGVPAPCGDDGCGGSCGECRGGDRCVDGLCDDCGEVTEVCCGSDTRCAEGLSCSTGDLCVTVCGLDGTPCCMGPVPCLDDLECSGDVCEDG